MPIRFRYHPERDLLIHVGEGPITIEDIREVRRARREAGVPESVANTLSDMRKARFDFDPRQLEAQESTASPEDYAGQRHAEIVDDPAQTAILMLWRTYVPEGVVVEIFSEPQRAASWLGVTLNEDELDF